MAADQAAATKSKIKKLTKDKIQEHWKDVVVKPGQLDLTHRGIETIVSLDGLKTFTKLDLSHNKLTKLNDMKNVSNLTWIKIVDNKFTGEGLTELQHLKKLVTLNAGENQIARIAPDVLRHMRELKALVLNNNSITTLEWLPRLPELNSLIVSHNRISAFLPRTIDRLPGLTKISISHNNLEEIPDLSVLSSITELRLSHNKIKKIPFSLANLKNLKILELGHNEIDDWEGIEALGRLQNLKQLSLTGNPIVGQALDTKTDGDESKSKEEMKELKRLDQKNKLYNFKMKRIFPNLVIRDGSRIMDKKTHGYVAPPKEEKPKKEKPAKKRKDPEPTEGEENEPAEPQAEKTKDKSKSKKAKREVNHVAKAADAKPKHKSEGDATKTNAKEVQTNTEVATESKKNKDKKHKATPSDEKSTEAAAVATAPTEKENKKEKKNADKKEKETKSRQKDDKKKRQPKDKASGVLAIKQFKKPCKKEASAPVDLTKVNFTPNVGQAEGRQSTPQEQIKMAENPLTSFIGSFMAPASKSEKETIEHLTRTQECAQFRLDDDALAHRKKGHHQHPQYTSPEGFPEVPRQFLAPSHSDGQDYATYGANSYASAIAITEMMKKRGI
ncbi:TPA: hypothetical protein N0F65_002313 [Lagenidium giganteum]|uniref:Uncharacterized protein n=1 Tax=Lagenidium giganteum TaxID=4803 RepID=A0AAV2Z2I3_9STRA|nr:TPA: hypothetical protein N0F65_002313 [Lagenidium giganteum]